jgi:hypothetical protein
MPKNVVGDPSFANELGSPSDGTAEKGCRLIMRITVTDRSISRFMLNKAIGMPRKVILLTPAMLLPVRPRHRQKYLNSKSALLWDA